jgi:sugar lactone lactonase YvrE
MGSATKLSLAVLVAFLLSACRTNQMPIEEVARADRQWTGVTVASEFADAPPDTRVFVNFPRWSDDVPTSVAELKPNGVLVPYPDEKWNSWTWAESPGRHFVCVQSVYCGPGGALWVLDPANPRFEGVVKGGPKLVKIDLTTDQVERVYHLPDNVAPERSYLNDVRVDPAAGYAYITDSGLGALVVLNLKTGESRRLLADHPSTRSEGVEVTIDGRVWRRPDGSLPDVHADGIALDRAEEVLYYQALTGRTLYRIPTKWLHDPEVEAWQLAEKVEKVAEPGPADGLAWDALARQVLLTSIELHAIRALDPETGEVQILAQDPRIAWPDSIAVFPVAGRQKGSDTSMVQLATQIYFTTSQIHLPPDERGPYRLFMTTRPTDVRLARQEQRVE